MKTKRLLMPLLISLLIGINLSSFGTTYYVDVVTGNDSPPNNGLSWLSPFKTISHAIDVSITNDVIKVKYGTYNEGLLIDKNITIEGIGTCIIDGQNISERYILAVEFARFINFTVRNMKSNSIPAVMFMAGGFISGIKVEGNPYHIGGLYASNVYTTLQTVVTSCRASNCYGYGINVENSTAADVMPLIVSNCTAYSNSGSGFIFGRLRQVDEIINIVSQGNSRGSGAGIEFETCTYAKLFNALITGNKLSAPTLYYSYRGAGIHFSGPSGTLELNSCTIASNRGNSITQGQAIYMEDNCTLKIKNCIVYNNKNNIGFTNPIRTMTSAYLQATNSCVQFIGSGNGNISSDPAFVNSISPDLAPTTTGDYHLGSTSPCINFGDPNTNLITGYITTDLDNKTRILEGRIDMGCYETGISGPPMDLLNNNFKKEINPGLSVYPNPVSSESRLSLSLKESANVTLTIYSSNGVRISDKCMFLKHGYNEILLSELSYGTMKSGLYIISIKGANINENVKFLVK